MIVRQNKRPQKLIVHTLHILKKQKLSVVANVRVIWERKRHTF